MDHYILSCCSTVDLSLEQLQQRNISFICFHFSLDEKEYPDDLGQSLPLKSFYEAMIAGAETKTSQVSAGEYYEYFSSFCKQGKDVLHISISSGISGTYTAACSGAALALKDYPARKIYIVDSRGASSGYGMFVDALADQRDAGLSLEELRDWAEGHKLNLHHWFFSTDLKWYVKGGRVSAPAGFIGGILGICPVLHMDAAGKLIPETKVRTKKKAMAAMVDRMERYAEGGKKYKGKCYLCHSYCLEDAEATAAMIEESFPDLNGKVQICNVGTVIGSHTGPGTIAVFFWGETRD